MPIIQSQFPASYSLSDVNGKTGTQLVKPDIQEDAYWQVSGVGDMNGDGISDIIVGDVRGEDSWGAAYVIFGHAEPWLATFNISNLNGNNGAKFVGGFWLDGIGRSVSSTGDVNGDGISDFITGAFGDQSLVPPGACYVFFGHRGPWITPFSMADLNGVNGGKFMGENAGDRCGLTVSIVGDVNGDKIDDFIIGADGSNSDTGASYLVFGHTGSWMTPFSLSKLNGTDGVKFLGETGGDKSGSAISGAGDVNGDGFSDILICSTRNNGKPVAAYLIFGHANPWSTPFSLSILNGVNGVKFLSENSNNSNDGNVAGIGDVNNDGISDFAIGANYNGVQATYVVFGHKSTWSTPVNLSSLNGVNGAKFLGGGAYTNSISGVGDINGDNINDLVIGAFNSDYLVFGHSGVWITPFNLDDSNGIASTKFLGHKDVRYSGSDVSGVGDVNKDGVNDCIMVTSSYPGESVASYIVFGDRRGQLLTNAPFTIVEGGSILLNNNYLNAIYDNRSLADVQFEVNITPYGYFQFVNQSSSYFVRSFTQQQINDNQIRYTHGGSCYASSYQISINDGGLSFIPINSNIIFIPINPVITQNNLFINQSYAQNSTVILKTSNLNATDPTQYLIYTVSNLQHGYFALTNDYSNNPIFQFTQYAINMGDIQFVANDSNHAPSYSVSVQNYCGLKDGPYPAMVVFYDIPILLKNKLTINQGQTLLLTTENLNATNLITPYEKLEFSVSNISHGYFEYARTPGIAVTGFDQKDISNGRVQFVHDGSREIPSYQTFVSNGFLSSKLDRAVITFHPNPPVVSPPDNTVRNAVIGSTIGGVALFGYFALKLGLKCKAEQHLEQLASENAGDEKQQAIFRKNIILPFAKEIFNQVKMTGCLGYISEQTMQAAFAAVMTLVTTLQNKGVEVDLAKLDSLAQVNLIDRVIQEIRRVCIPKKSCCSYARFTSFFKAEMTPDQLVVNAEAIAAAVKAALDSQYLQISISQGPESEVKSNARSPLL